MKLHILKFYVLMLCIVASGCQSASKTFEKSFDVSFGPLNIAQLQNSGDQEVIHVNKLILVTPEQGKVIGASKTTVQYSVGSTVVRSVSGPTVTQVQRYILRNDFADAVKGAFTPIFPIDAKSNRSVIIQLIPDYGEHQGGSLLNYVASRIYFRIIVTLSEGERDAFRGLYIGNASEKSYAFVLDGAGYSKILNDAFVAAYKDFRERFAAEVHRSDSLTN